MFACLTLQDFEGALLNYFLFLQIRGGNEPYDRHWGFSGGLMSTSAHTRPKPYSQFIFK